MTSQIFFFTMLKVWYDIQLIWFPFKSKQDAWKRGKDFTTNYLLMSEAERRNNYDNLKSILCEIQKKNTTMSDLSFFYDCMPLPFSSTNSLQSNLSDVSFLNDDFELD